MALIDAETRREVDEVDRLEQDISRFTAGHQSEPTTPPEYHDTAFSSVFTRSNRFSSASMTSPPGLSNRPSRSGSQLTSPPSNFSRPSNSSTGSQLPSKSMPGSRRGSDEEEDEDGYIYEFSNTNHRAAANPNRNSMPVTGLDLRNRSDMPDMASLLGQVNTTGFLFGDEDEKPLKKTHNSTASPDAKTYLQLHTTDDKFPILVRHDGDGTMQLSASSAALDLALSQSPAPETQQMTDRATAAHNRKSLPPSALRHSGAFNGDLGLGQLNGILTDPNAVKNPAANRRSLEVKFSGLGETKRPPIASPPNGVANGFPKLQSSYSTNDIPTLKSTGALSSPPNQNITTPVKSGHEPSYQIQNSNLSRTSPNTASTRFSAEFSGIDAAFNVQSNGFRPAQSVLQASAAPFGPSVTSPAVETSNITNNLTAAPMSQFAAPAYYGGYGMQMLNGGFNNMYLGNQAQWNNQMQPYQAGFGGFPQYSPYGGARAPDSQSRIIQQRRMQSGEENARFANVKLESLLGEVYGLCKDQHGCRYLQKKLEDGDPEHIRLIFEETNTHVIDLMTDPFGNYLCQKLLEFTNDEQRTVLIRNAAPQMVQIALNQHGTRALQKMIEFVSTPEQTQTIIQALQFEVVPLIQDLNGNHVIQKCLNHLTPIDAQFIFDAVGAHCVTVGTHRHGCCVLQRCIDHASGLQKGQLIHQITMNAYNLVQDPFGNYVVQYILELNEPSFSEPLCLSFLGSVAPLSKQKFSSNVIEKCIRTASDDTKRLLIEEMLNSSELEKLLRDSFANYVVQTAMDYADNETKSRMVENIRPILPALRHTPHGRRIQSKIQEHDGRVGSVTSGQITPVEMSSPSHNSFVSRSGSFGHHAGNQFTNDYISPTSAYSGGNNYSISIASPTPHRTSNAPLPMFAQHHGHGMNAHGFAPLGRPTQYNGIDHY
ncbi:hypothetical protein LTR66_007948 [Elasticomyces elasticus]|nr:hypothetical protein LTR66_007948 [Elasticomyces elasticus]